MNMDRKMSDKEILGHQPTSRRCNKAYTEKVQIIRRGLSGDLLAWYRRMNILAGIAISTGWPVPTPFRYL